MDGHQRRLAAVDKGGVLKLLLNRTNLQLYRKFYRREMYLEDIATRSGDPDDFIIDGFDHSHIIGHATYAEAIEFHIDIEKVITEMAEMYMESLPHLASLYYLRMAMTVRSKGVCESCKTMVERLSLFNYTIHLL